MLQPKRTACAKLCGQEGGLCSRKPRSFGVARLRRKKHRENSKRSALHVTEVACTRVTSSSLHDQPIHLCCCVLSSENRNSNCFKQVSQTPSCGLLQSQHPSHYTIGTIGCFSVWRVCMCACVDTCVWHNFNPFFYIINTIIRNIALKRVHAHKVVFKPEDFNLAFLSLKISLFIFNWRTIALQYCIGLCLTST